MPDSSKIIVVAGTTAAISIAFNSILLTRYFLNYYNCSSNYIT